MSVLQRASVRGEEVSEASEAPVDGLALAAVPSNHRRQQYFAVFLNDLLGCLVNGCLLGVGAFSSTVLRLINSPNNQRNISLGDLKSISQS